MAAAAKEDAKEEEKALAAEKAKKAEEDMVLASNNIEKEALPAILKLVCCFSWLFCSRGDTETGSAIGSYVCGSSIFPLTLCVCRLICPVY